MGGGSVSGWGECLHQPLERYVLMGERVQGGVADLVEELGEGGVAGQVGAQHQGVDEEADQIVEGLVCSAGYRCTDGYIGSRTQAGQQHSKRRLYHHEQSRTRLPGEFADAMMQLGVDLEVDGFAPERCHRWPGAVEWQLQLLGQTGQGFGPE